MAITQGEGLAKMPCEDCGKIPPEAYGHLGKNIADWYYYFRYFAKTAVWLECAPFVHQLCLCCLRKRVDRKMTLEDFPDALLNKNLKYRKHLVWYANRQINDDPTL